MFPDVVVFDTASAAATIEPVPVSPIPVVAVRDTFPVPAFTAPFTEMLPVFCIETSLPAGPARVPPLTIRAALAYPKRMAPPLFRPLEKPTPLTARARDIFPAGGLAAEI